MPVNLTEYRGDAGLGLGANPDISAPANLGVLNNTMRDLSLLDNERNITLFKQKVADRNNLEQLILNNEVSTGDIQPEDQKYFDTAKGKVEQAYDEWGGNFNNTQGFRKYQDAVRGLQDTATHAQTRWAGLKKLEQEKSQQTLPSKIKQYDDWIGKQKDLPFGSQITPFQQLHDFSIDDINKIPPPRTSQVAGSPGSGISYDVTSSDYDDVLKFKRDQYINDQDARDSIDNFTDKFFSKDPTQMAKSVDAANKKLDQYNTERGLQEGQPGFAPHINIENGVVTDPKTEFAAKWALASQPTFVTRTLKVNKDLMKNQIDQAKLAQGQEKIKLEARKVGIDQEKANAYVKHLNAATAKILEQSQQDGTDITKMYNDFVDNITPGGIVLGTESGKKQSNAIFMDELPEGYQFINGAVVNPKSGKVTPGQLLPFISSDKKDKAGKNAGSSYYLPKYIDPKTGKEVDSDLIFNKLKEWKAGGFNGNKEDMIRILLKTPGALELVLQGRNGTVNYSAMSQAARVMNNIGGSKKGQENIINPPETSQSEPEQTEPSDNQ